jgi:hypothetical protein
MFYITLADPLAMTGNNNLGVGPLKIHLEDLQSGFILGKTAKSPTLPIGLG